MYTYLKFGLPRVFPPSRGPRDGSSGYNSSDDGSPGALKGRGPMRTRSEMDFRNLQMHAAYARPPQSRNGRAISNSEANLLSVGSYYQQEHPRTRRSVAGMERPHRASEHRVPEHRKSFHDLRSAAMMESTQLHRSLAEQRRASKAGSHLSLNQRKLVPEFAAAARPHSAMGHINHGVAYYGGNGPATEEGPFHYPHLQVRNLEIESKDDKGRFLVQGVSLEVRGGELLSVMTTQASEGSLLLSALAGEKSAKAGKVAGEFILNGNVVDRRQLRKRCALVRCDCNWDLDLTVKQTLHFQSRLRRVKHRYAKIPVRDKISSLIEDLGLDQVSGTKLSGLTKSELRRLSVAIYLMMDVDLLFLDQPTRGMDIFDTFFLIEYLRQSSLNSGIPDITGRAIVLTLQPPTYEILTMISRVLVISNGHVMYSGLTSLLLPYFTSVEYPCPPYKNPSDYYLDLVTLDDLSAEAMLESSQRMAQLGEVQRRRQEPLSDPGPPNALPPELARSSLPSQASTLFMRSMVWSQPSSFIRHLFHILLAAIISFLIGAIFWDVPGSDTQLLLGDRLGFHYTVFCVALWPLLILSSLSAVRRERKFVADEISENLYDRTVYVFVKLMTGLPGNVIMWLAYLVPSYIMSGLHYQGTNAESTKTFYLYVSMGVVYLHGLHLAATGISWLVRNTFAAVFVIFLLFATASVYSGFPIHVDDAGVAGHLVRISSPAWWITTALLRRELREDAFRDHNHVCKNKQVQRQRPEIIVQIACPTPNGTAELEYHNMLPQRGGVGVGVGGGVGHWASGSGAAESSLAETEDAFFALGCFWLASFLAFWIFFAFSTKFFAPKEKVVRSTNKP